MRPRLGFVLSLLAAALWGSLPIAIRPVVEVVDPITLTWTRYIVAAAGLGVMLAWQGKLPGRMPWVRFGLAALAFVGFGGNNFLYLAGLRATSPAAAQIVIQLAPILVIIGAVRWFGESFGRMQWVGAGVLLLGIPVFFHQKLAGFSSGYGYGLLAVFCAAFFWAGYALLQKKMLKDMSSISIMFLIYVIGSVAMLPFITPSTLAGLDDRRWWLLAYCCLNSLLSYGFFSEALAVWQASRVSAVVATAPLFTVLFGWGAEPMDFLNLAGAGLVVAGCMAMALRK